jgi:stage V sporulation protein R
MSRDWTTDELERWDGRIQEKVAELGLSCFPQEFEICDHEQMLGYMAYSGMPAHYPHWSYGKAFEKQKTLYDQGVSGLPYEMVINSNPCLAYLMRGNSLCLQILTIAHVYGHNDFFRNNFTFAGTRPELTVEMFKARADRVRAYVEDPSIGIDRVEALLDAAHALSLQCRRNLSIRRLSPEEQKARIESLAQPRHDPFHRIHRAPERTVPDVSRVPLEPDEDLLLFIRDHNRQLAEWQRDLLTIVHEQARYFVPQIETKIMNEGWASYWHHRIMTSLELPEDLHLEFLVHHNQVVRPHPGRLNPYYLGFKIWHDIVRRTDDPEPDEIEEYGRSDLSGIEKIFEVRETDRDVSFLRRFLTERLMREMDMYSFGRQGDHYVVEQVADEEHWENIKGLLLRGVGMGSVPVIKVIDADFGGSRTLQLRHEHEGRDLDREYSEKTLAHLYRLWGRKVVLETTMRESPCRLAYDESGFSESVGQPA